MGAGCKFEMELEPGPPLEVARPNFLGLAWADARDEKEEREVVWLVAEAHRREVVDSVVKEMGAEKFAPIVREATCYPDENIGAGWKGFAT